jgi:lipopolysaccharide transport system permease protein
MSTSVKQHPYNVSLDKGNHYGSEQEKWTEIIEPSTRLFDLHLDELWRYRDLVIMFVRRDIVSNYKQTILGPLWFFIQPLLTTITFVLIFGKAAGLAPNSIPMVIFYLSGVTFWSYFSEVLNKTATVFKDNAQMFGKVYFPRLTMPFSIVIANLLRFGIQFFLFLIFWGFFLAKGQVHPNHFIVLLPLLIIIMGLLALGLGMIISAATTKYKDLIFLLTFGIQLMMFATPIIYPISKISKSSYSWIIKANPMTSVIEAFRFGFLGSGSFSWIGLGYSASVTCITLLIGSLIFNKVEKSFTDTV